MSHDEFAILWGMLGGRPEAARAVELTGAGPGLPSSFQVGLAAQLSIAAAGLAAVERHQLATGVEQTLKVDRQSASIECRSERYALLDGKPLPELWDSLAGAYQCGDGRYVRLHTNFPHHRDGVVDLLGCRPERGSVAKALGSWRGEDFEQQATARGLVVALMRSFEEWDAHPHSAAVRALPLVSITRIGDAAPAARRQASARPLADLRVLEMTRIIAGPVAGRTLAAHGADVLRVIGERVPTIAVLDIDTGRGKRSAHVDIAGGAGLARIEELVAGADILLQSYRPGALAARGLAAEQVARLRPGIVVGSLSAYGRSGPWADKRGFDSLVQTATGFNAAEAAAAGSSAPKPLPMQILDHASGFLLAAGLIMARIRQEREGGSWHVEVSLARTGDWLRGLGRIASGLAEPEPRDDEIAARLETSPSGYGSLTAVRHAAELSATPARWMRPSRPYGSDAAAW